MREKRKINLLFQIDVRRHFKLKVLYLIETLRKKSKINILSQINVRRGEDIYFFN